MIKLDTQAQADLIDGQLCNITKRKELHFCVVYDINDNPFITEVEQEQCNNPEFMLVKDLQEAEFIPKQTS